ncbi:MAG: hypothetical protein JJ863_31795 [Deltaproteobacteria bacterium]|nr:hypothetical protein [Deltaproteobacteria bacterium]
MSELQLPLPAEALPAKVRRFGDPNAPTPAKTMAAKGLVPVRGADLVTLLTQLGADEEQTVAEAARSSLSEMPDDVLLPILEGGELHPAILHGLATTLYKNDEVLERIIEHPAVHSETVERIARHCSERVTEVIATNQIRLLEAPEIVESLYKNKHARMSTIDRLVELCARNDVRLEGIPSFDAHVKAIQGQLIPEPTDEPLPTDTFFQEALEEDDGEGAVDIDKVDGTEELREKSKPLSFRIKQMSLSEKIRMAVVGDAAARSILIRDPNRMVSHAAISSPSMSEPEAAAIAHSKEVSEDILRYIGNRKEWLRSYEVKRALVFNPKTPVGISMRFLGHLRNNDLKLLSKSRGVPNPLKTAARQRLEKKTRGRS